MALARQEFLLGTASSPHRARLDEAARGGDAVDVVVPLRMVLSMLGAACRPKMTPRRFTPPWSRKLKSR